MNETTHETSKAASVGAPATGGAQDQREPLERGDRARASEAPASKQLGIEITQSAVDAVASQIAKRGVAGTMLRVGIRGGGCSGFSYVVEFHDGEPRARDTVYDLKATDGTDVRIVVDKKSLLYLSGSIFDWEKTLMRQGFKFVNPNEKSSCGCGTSFTV